MSKTLLIICCCVGALLMFACAKPESTTNREASPTNSSVPKTTPASTPATTASTGDKIGIAECDNFLTSYENCVSTKIPEVARAQYKTSIATWRTEWKKLADNPQTRATLAGVCKTQLDAARTSMKSFGCTF